jgi:PTS system cellobiose-specific IIC component
MSRSSAASKPSSAASKLFLAFEARAVPVMRRLGDLAFVAAVRDALPWSFIGLAAAFVAVLGEQLASGSAAATLPLGLRLAGALLPAFGVMAGTLVVVLPVRLARETRYAVAPLLVSSIGAFALALPRPFGPDPVGYLRLLGTSGLFLAILACGVAAASTAILRRSRVPQADWIAALLTVSLFALLIPLHVSLPAAIAAAMHPIADLGDTYFALIAIVFIETLLWTAGVHGPAVLAAIVTPVYLTMQMQNTHAFTLHAPLPYVVVVSLFLFVFPGGAGATLPLAALLAVSSVPRLRRVGRVTIVPALFNLNEPLLFAAPVVFNPHLVVPFVGVPLVLATVTYAAVALGVVSRAAFYVPSSIPTVISTYLATQDVRAIGLASFNIVLATLMYYPFVRAYERHVAEEGS